MIHVYECLSAPIKRRYLAQCETIPENMYLVIHGPSAEIATAKMNLHLQYRALPPNERKDFDLKGKLEALNSGQDVRVLDDAEDPEEELLADEQVLDDEDDLL